MLPTREEAENELIFAGEFHPGAWITQSYNVAEVAELIAKRCDNLDGDKAYILGILHDIGRRERVNSHPAYACEGYKYCIRKGWDEVAKICVTHLYPLKELEFSSTPSSEEAFLKQYLEYCTYDDYDMLIILCEALTATHDFSTLEQRFIKMAIGDHVDDIFLSRWNKLFEIKEYFEQKMSVSLYSVLKELTGYEYTSISKQLN